jgi:hypothetical protein
MTTIEITDKGKEILENVLSESKESPFFRKDDKLYFKYNKIKIENQSSFWKGGIIVSYCWNDVALFEQKTSGISFEKGSSLILNGIEGHIEINFNFTQG